MATMLARGLLPSDRVLYLGIGQLRGKHGDVLCARPRLTIVRFDLGWSLFCRTQDLHPIPRRPLPDF